MRFTKTSPCHNIKQLSRAQLSDLQDNAFMLLNKCHCMCYLNSHPIMFNTSQLHMRDSCSLSIDIIDLKKTLKGQQIA